MTEYAVALGHEGGRESTGPVETEQLTVMAAVALSTLSQEFVTRTQNDTVPGVLICVPLYNCEVAPLIGCEMSPEFPRYHW